jgi:hypothetical protein
MSDNVTFTNSLIARLDRVNLISYSIRIVKETVAHQSGKMVLQAPLFDADIALKIAAE